MNEWFAVSCVLAVSAAAACAAVLLVRGILWKAPKRLVCFLWLAVFVRAVFPVSIHSPFSVNGALTHLPGGEKTEFLWVSPGEAAALIDPFLEAEQAVKAAASGKKMQEAGAAEAVLGKITGAAEGLEKVTGGQEPETPFGIKAAFGIWLAGAAALLLESLISWMRLKKSVSDAGRIGGNVYESDQIPTAFVLGFFSPKIYLPAGLSDSERELVETHERMHCKWQEPRLKAVLWVITAVCWYHPALWISFAGWNRDMEMACDERVLQKLGQERKKEYGSFLLKLSSPRSMPGAGPLAFGESSVKTRIKNIVSYHPCRKWAAGLTILAVGATMLACVSDAPKETEAVFVIGGADGPTSVFIAGKLGDGEETDSQEPEETERAEEAAGTENEPGTTPETVTEITAQTASADFSDDAGKKQEEVFEKTETGWQTSDWESRTFFDITTAKDFAEAYAQWKPDYQGIPDGMREPAKSFGDWLAESAQKGEPYALEYADPVRALELTLHVSGGSGETRARENGTMEVVYTFPDGAVTVQMVHPNGSGGELIWVPGAF